MAGPLTGYKVIELAGIGPGPFAAMMLADLGAEVIMVERTAAAATSSKGPRDIALRGRRSIALDLKQREGVDALLRLIDSADVLIEGFRPGVMERLGVGPDLCLERNPKLVYGRMTGWGQTGPYALTAGHDINYISLAGVLAHIGRAGEGPVPPLNLVGDFGGGAMFLVAGVLAALLEAQRSGAGQVVDAAMIDGAAMLMTMFWSMRSLGIFDETQRGSNLLDSGAPYYDVYRCADGEYVSVGAIEPQFYALLLDKAGLADDPRFARQNDRKAWPEMKQALTEVFASKTRAEWCALLEYTDACFAPVLRMSEAAQHRHNVERQGYVEIDGVVQPAPAPRFSRTPAGAGSPPAFGQDTRAVLSEIGLPEDEIDALYKSGAVA